MGLANHYALSGDLVKADEYFEQTARATGERGPRHVVGFENTAGLIAGLRGDWAGVRYASSKTSSPTSRRSCRRIV